MHRSKLALIAAVASNGAIGKNNELLFRFSDDMQHFKRTTLGHPVIMGRKTWDSLPARSRPLPGRLNIVVTHNTAWQAEGATVTHSLEDALACAPAAETVYVIGGAALFAAAMPLADTLVLTEVSQAFDADVYFPNWSRSDFEETARDAHHAGEPHHFDYAFVTYQRKR